MIIKSIQLSNFRNYEKLDISFDSETNIIYGDNAQGKTNILEAAYLSGTTKSHKGSKDKEMIRFGEDEAHIRTIVEKNDKEYRIDMHLRKNGAKGVAINKMPIKKASELFGILNIVFFSPEDLNIIKNGPAERRRFIDLELCQLDKIYLSNLSKYNKTLVQRNRLLKDIAYRPDLIDTLQVWDMQLLEYGRHVIKKRREFVNELNEIIQDIHSNISGGREKLILKYEPSIDDIFFEDELLKARSRDLKLCQTTVGPHRDDMLFSVDGVDIRKISLRQLRRSVAVVLQDVFLFSDTIEENIKMGNRSTMQMDEIKSAAASAQASSFIEKMDEQYETVIGERGVGLSGGQKQRISIARALSKHSPILVMDDSTSALDMETEHEIQKTLNSLKDTTKIIIAHRISAVCHADEIIYLQDGRIAERGTHEELLAKKGLYYDTYMAQYGGYLAS